MNSFGGAEVADMLFALEPEDLERLAIPIGQNVVGISTRIVLAGARVRR